MDREVRKKRITYKLKKLNEDKLRISIYRSNSNIYAQIIDDSVGLTLASASSICKKFKENASKDEKGYNLKGARLVGKLLGENFKSEKSVYFDRSGYRYTGRIKELADGAREFLKF